MTASAPAAPSSSVLRLTERLAAPVARVGEIVFLHVLSFRNLVRLDVVELAHNFSSFDSRVHSPACCASSGSRA